MLQTLERTNIFDARVLTAAHADALRALAGPGGLPLLPCLHPALEEGQIVGDYAGQDELQAAAALLPLYAEDPLPTVCAAAGYGADGQGAVLTPPILREDYTQLRHFLRLARAGPPSGTPATMSGPCCRWTWNTRRRVMICVRSISRQG